MSERLTPEAFFGEKAAKDWRDIVNAAQRFASATGCLAGDDVFDWYKAKSEEYFEAQRMACKPYLEGM